MTDIEKQDRIGEMMREYREESRRQAHAASKVRESERDQQAALIASQAARIRELEETATDVIASLVAAVSLLERGGKRAAPSDKMFAMMLADYNASIKRARSLLSRKGGE